MALEDPTYINEFVITNPEPTDKRRFGDDHIRNIKGAIKRTFPNIEGQILPSHTELNALDGISSNVQAQLNTKLESSNLPDLAPYARRNTSNSWGAVQSQGTVDLGNVSGVVAIDASAGTTFILNLTEDITALSFSGHIPGQEITLKLVQAGTGGYTVGFGGQFHFADGIAPVLSTVVGSYDIASGKIISNVAVMGFLRGLASV